ncbi:hypothetical protein ACFP7A_05665 [Sporolactobacillus kofuensis]|uniref:Lipoprotein n=1 Tax=Sporolactobacillus kofuensis TaxID=269672 RepID=A0ABW1WD22_9BACL|nr:hypothetical protein [Sporolactobacillus kofuensis]MCO7175165.1 hypothetical protein [Sporolactobacillus kofuensis]
MKKTLITLFLVTALILSGCGNQEDNAYDQAMKKGQAALVSKDYERAAKYFKVALSHKKKDKKATVLATQTTDFLIAKSFMNQPDQAIKALNAVILQKNGSGALRKAARAMRDKLIAANQKKQTQEPSASTSQVTTSDESSNSSSDSSVGNTDESTSTTSSTSSSQTGKSSTSSSALITQQKAEAAVIKAAGYTPDQVYIDTTDEGAYYSMELRENHTNDSAADPDTAPSAGFFRYYKNSGKITKLDLLSNTYKSVK